MIKTGKQLTGNWFGRIGIQQAALMMCFICAILSETVIAKPYIKVEATVKSDEVGLGDSFIYSINVTSSESVTIDPPALKGLQGFQLQSSAKQESYSNQLKQTDKGLQFESTYRHELQFVLVAKQLGRITIPSMDVAVNGHVEKTNPIIMNVVEESRQLTRKQRNQMQQNPGSLFDEVEDEEDIFNQLLQQRQQLLNQAQRQFGRQGNFPGAPAEDPMFDPKLRTLPKNPNEAFFVQVEADKTEAYVGEQITVAWSIYTRGQLESLDRVKFPDLRGFWKEIIEEVPALNFSPEIINGVEYRRALLAAHALFPIKAGESVVDEFKIKSKVRSQSAGGWALGKAYEYTKSSERVVVKVKPLPTENKPADFSGAVGQFEVNASVEKNVVAANQPLTLRIRFEGKGNAKLIELPNIAFPSSLENYDTKSDSKFSKNGTSFKEFIILLIPRAIGEVEIPTFSVSFFDPSNGQYYTKTVEPIKLKIEGSLAEPLNKKSKVIGDVKEENVFPQPLLEMTYPTIAQNLSYPWFHVQIIIAILIILFLRFLFIVFFGRRRVSLKDAFDLKMKKVDLAIKEKNLRKVGSEMMNVLFFVVSEVSGIKSTSNQISTIVEELPLVFKKQFGERLTEVLKVFEEISFAPDSVLTRYQEPKVIGNQVSSAKKLLLEMIDSQIVIEKS